MYFKELQERFNTLRKRMDPETIKEEKRVERRKGMVKGFAIGSMIAGIAALFLSPGDGENNRKKAKEGFKKAKNILETNIVTGKEKLVQVYENTKEAIDEGKNVLTEKLRPNSEMNILEEDFEEIGGDSEEVEKDLEEMKDEEI
ncbi:MAG TPA: YtxH domain-containing protein [Clostridia bacterium]|nr:YtxH domain-containing protein [Clostridia bacterium]